MENNKIVLPDRYYLTYYNHLLSVIESKYTTLLSDKEKAYISSFKALTQDAQCLYLRLQNRKGKYFRFSKFSYPEINNLALSLQELLRKDFCQIINTSEDDFCELLHLYNKQELIDLAAYLQLSKKGLAKLNKTSLVQHLAQMLPTHKLLEIFIEEPIIKQGFVNEALMIQFLYFGTLDLDMSQFVIRDIGNLKFEQFDEKQLSTTFLNRKDAEDKLMLSLAYNYFRELRHVEPPLDYFELVYNWLKNTRDLELSAKPLYDRLVLKSGKLVEQAKLFEEAFLLYQFTDKAPSRERRIRLLQKTGKEKEAIDLCNKTIHNPKNAEEKYFAKDFLLNLTTKKRVIRSTRQFQKASEVIAIDKNWQYQVEMGALDYYQKKQWNGFFAENYIWRSIWGLLFWDIVFDDKHTGIHHPFQRSPDDLFTEDFLMLRKDSIYERIKILKNQTACFDYLQKIYEQKYGTANPVIGWYPELWQIIEYMVNVVPLFRLEKVMLAMCQNLKDNAKGFPDLFLFKKDDYCFVEIKSPTDSLSAQQLFWLELFKEVGINSKLVNVKWE